MDIFDILACPACKVKLYRADDYLECPRCNQAYPIVNGIPVIFPGGGVPAITYEADLQVRDSYDPWVHRVILQSLLDDQVVLEIGSGNMGLDDPCILRMDVMLTPYVDLVADAHSLPFLPESIDYIFSLAVFEHLRNPFQAAQSIYETLKDGGFIYHECNFVFAYHGYPDHYFNASLQGMEQVFSQFIPLRKGVAPYQMPSFALNMVLQTYLRHSNAGKYRHGKRWIKRLKQVLEEDLAQYDIYFSEEAALNVAAGTFFAGMKQLSPSSSLIPNVIQDIWRGDRQLQDRFPNMNQITTADNLLAWAKGEGRAHYREIEAYLGSLPPFNKRGAAAPWSRAYIHSLPLVEARFGAIGVNPDDPIEAQGKEAERQARVRIKQNKTIADKLKLFRRALQMLRQEGFVQGIKRLIEYPRYPGTHG